MEINSKLARLIRKLARGGASLSDIADALINRGMCATDDDAWETIQFVLR